MRHTLFRPSADDAYSGAPMPSLYSAVNALLAAGAANDADAVDTALYKLDYEVRVAAMTIDEVAALLRPKLLAERELAIVPQI